MVPVRPLRARAKVSRRSQPCATVLPWHKSGRHGYLFGFGMRRAWLSLRRPSLLGHGHPAMPQWQRLALVSVFLCGPGWLACRLCISAGPVSVQTVQRVKAESSPVVPDCARPVKAKHRCALSAARSLDRPHNCATIRGRFKSKSNGNSKSKSGCVIAANVLGIAAQAHATAVRLRRGSTLRPWPGAAVAAYSHAQRDGHSRQRLRTARL